MFNKNFVFTFLLTAAPGVFLTANAQVLTLKDAVQTAVNNYGSIKAKTNYVNAARALVKESSNEALPDLNLSAQQDYGTVNGQFGPLYGFKGFGTASSGPSLAAANWNAAFGALYLANINWDFYSFGKARQKVKVSASQLTLQESDLSQEKFQLQVKVASAYLNLLAAQKLTKSAQDNLDRATALRDAVVPRVKNGLNAGVDSSLANAGVSNAKIAVLRAKDYEQEQANQLAILLSIPQQEFTLDSLFITRIPASIKDSPVTTLQNHPLLQFYQNRINASNETAKYLHTFLYPTFSAFGIAQGRGSGFSYNYGSVNPNAFTHNYFTGINPTVGNYLLGVGVIWNLTSPLRVQQQVIAQQFTSKGLKDEYNLLDEQLKNQYVLAELKMHNAINAYTEAPVQVKAASDAYLQKSVLYKNGLSNIVDVTQALYALNLAETDQAISENNVWGALLLKAAATGDFGLFINEF
jgi:outer membrane protein TolC